MVVGLRFLWDSVGSRAFGFSERGLGALGFDSEVGVTGVSVLGDDPLPDLVRGFLAERERAFSSSSDDIWQALCVLLTLESFDTTDSRCFVFCAITEALYDGARFSGCRDSEP